MSTEAILAELRSERAVKIKDRDTLQRHIDQLDTAINALEGRAVNGEGPSIPDIIKAAAESFGKGQVFDVQSLIGKARQAHPDHEGRLKRGIYNAMRTLEKRDVIRRCPGGFCLK